MPNEQDINTGDTLIIAVVPVTLVPLLWNEMEPHLQRVVDKSPNEMSTETLNNELMSGECLASIVYEGTNIIATCVFQRIELDTGRPVLYVKALGGERIDEWLERMTKLGHLIASDMGCVELRLNGRPGWTRKLKDDGWEVAHTVLTCKVRK